MLSVAASLVSFLQDAALVQGKRIDFDTDKDTSIRASADDVLDFEVGASDVMQLTATTLDGKSVLRLTNFAGMRETFVFAFGNTSTATLAATFYTAATTFMGTSAKRGARMMRPGSITKIHIVCDVNIVGTGDTLEGQVLKNFVTPGVFAAEISDLTVANGLEADASQAVGVDTFVAGDYLAGRRVLTGASPGQVTTDDFRITIEVEYD